LVTARGPFSGAAADKEGNVQKADGGTLFLDEVGDMSLTTQSKFCGRWMKVASLPVGGEASIVVDVRVIAATIRIWRRNLAREFP